MASAANAPAQAVLDHDWADMPMSERMTLQYRVEQFLYEEAELLDARRYPEWLALCATDIKYWMPIRRTVTQRDIEREFTKRGDMSFFDDVHHHLSMRVKKLEAGSAWSEDPPSRSRHFVTNVRVLGVAAGEVSVRSCFYLYRSRLNTEVDVWTGRREDVLRVQDDSFLLAKRDIYLDQTLIRATNMSTMF